MEKKIEVSILCQIYGKLLTEKQFSFIDDYYNNDLSLSEISQNEGITRQGARDCIKRAENTLYDIENRLKLIERFENIRQKLDEIENQANDILEIIYANLFNFWKAKSIQSRYFVFIIFYPIFVVTS